jgi:hypothetical protein
MTMATESSDFNAAAIHVAAPEPKSRDCWDKLDIILKFVGAIGTAVVLACVGFFGSQFLARRQAADTDSLARRQESETDLRLYTDLMSKREEADTSLRKEMFNSIMTNFLKPASEEQPDKMVLNLELLAYNFHDSLDLAPLFKDVHKKLLKHPQQNKNYLDRLEKVTRDVVSKQIAMLDEASGRLDGSISFADVNTDVNKGKAAIAMQGTVKIKPIDHPRDPYTPKQVRVEVLSVDPVKQELEVRLIVRTPPDTDAEQLFTLGFFDFPMLDNIRLSQGLRCAIVLQGFDVQQGMADLTLVIFPGSRAGLKEKPYYDEILSSLRRPSVAASSP